MRHTSVSYFFHSFKYTIEIRYLLYPFNFFSLLLKEDSSWYELGEPRVGGSLQGANEEGACQALRSKARASTAEHS